MIRGPKIAPVVLTADERDTLQRWARRPTTAQALAMRARIVLTSVTLHSVSAVARELRVTKPTAARWRQRFVTQRLDGLLDEPRPGAPRRITDADVERVLVTTLESTPLDATHWSTRSLAKHCGMTQTAVARIWKAFALQPHRTETFKLSKDPLFIEKVRDIVGLYLHPPARALVLCVDEKIRFKPWIAARRCCPCGQGKSSVAPMTMLAMARRRCSPHSMSGPAMSSATVMPDIGRSNSGSFWIASRPPCHRTSTCS
jgi:transposase